MFLFPNPYLYGVIANFRHGIFNYEITKLTSFLNTIIILSQSYDKFENLDCNNTNVKTVARENFGTIYFKSIWKQEVKKLVIFDKSDDYKQKVEKFSQSSWIWPTFNLNFPGYSNFRLQRD